MCQNPANSQPLRNQQAERKVITACAKLLKLIFCRGSTVYQDTLNLFGPTKVEKCCMDLNRQLMSGCKYDYERLSLFATKQHLSDHRRPPMYSTKGIPYDMIFPAPETVSLRSYKHR